MFKEIAEAEFVRSPATFGYWCCV